ncbi:MAG: hypothetical protein FWG14_01995 [Peptococcaceae bacterium]|nr:hypothetical protein [Peptococcaceae bacterium]
MPVSLLLSQAAGYNSFNNRAYRFILAIVSDRICFPYFRHSGDSGGKAREGCSMPDSMSSSGLRRKGLR